MLLSLDFSSDIPIYMQIRNQIVLGIADGKLAGGDRLPTIRALAGEAGVNMMTVNKAYALLKQEGYIVTDRRSGAVVSGTAAGGLAGQSADALKIIISEAKLHGISKDALLKMCAELYDMEGTQC